MSIHWLYSHVAMIVGVLLAFLLVARVIGERRAPGPRLSWVLIVLLLPELGVPLYLIFGGRKLKRRARSKNPLGLREHGIIPAEDAPGIDRMLRSFGMPGASRDNRLELKRSGRPAFDAAVELIEQARSTLCVEMYIFTLDDVGCDILDRLARRAREGVAVRLLVDSIGSYKTTRRRLRALTDAGGKVAFFMPVLHFPFRGRTNLRDHRKIIVADDRKALAGGANIAREYLGSPPEVETWHDLAFTVEGPAVRHYAQVFRRDWEFASGETMPEATDGEAAEEPGRAVLQVVPSGPDVEDDPLYDGILSAAFAAERRLWIVTPYFVPDEALLRALVLAARRGVDLRILVPAHTDERMIDIVRGLYLREIDAEGGQVMLKPGVMVHAKALLKDDDLAIVGSPNVDQRSLFVNYEIALFIYSPNEVAAVARYAESLMSGVPVGVKPVGPLRNFLESVLQLAAPLL